MNQKHILMNNHLNPIKNSYQTFNFKKCSKNSNLTGILILFNDVKRDSNSKFDDFNQRKLLSSNPKDDKSIIQNLPKNKIAGHSLIDDSFSDSSLKNGQVIINHDTKDKSFRRKNSPTGIDFEDLKKYRNYLSKYDLIKSKESEKVLVCFCKRNDCKNCRNNNLRDVSLFSSAFIGEIVRHAIIRDKYYYAVVVGQPYDNKIISWKNPNEILEDYKYQYHKKMSDQFRKFNISLKELSYSFKFIDEKSEYDDELLTALNDAGLI